MNIGIKWSRKGKSIKGTEPFDTPIDSKLNTLKRFLSGSGTASVATGVVWETTITHNLGYKVKVEFFFKHPETGYWHKATSYGGVYDTGTWNLYGNVKNVDTNSIKLRLYDGLPTEDMPSSPTNVEYSYKINIDPRKDAWYE